MEKQLKQIIEKAKIKIKVIDNEIDGDTHHNCKRRYSFELLDKLLESCMNGKCPNIEIGGHMYLVDISAEGYVKERAYFDYIDGTGNDSKKRYYKALSRITNILNCSKTPTLKEEIFKYDYDDLNSKSISGAKKRKAYWTYMANMRGANYEDNYYNSCKFINELLKKYSDAKSEINEVVKLKEIWKNNLHITNGIDLYGFCYVRQCYLSCKRISGLSLPLA